MELLGDLTAFGRLSVGGGSYVICLFHFATLGDEKLTRISYKLYSTYISVSTVLKKDNKNPDKRGFIIFSVELTYGLLHEVLTARINQRSFIDAESGIDPNL